MSEPPTIAVTDTASAEAATPSCQNCGAPLLGPHCYRCGQPVNGLVRHFSSILGDFLDSVLNIDARIFRTLWPLFARPGFLSREYFSGRRVRYVSPVRLFVFLSIVTFFVAQLMLNLAPNAIQFDDQGSIQQARTVAEVESARDQALKELEQARQQIPGNVPGARVGVDAGANAVREQARKRIAELQASDTGTAPADATEKDAIPDLEFNGRPWDPVTNPVQLRWLPAFANRWINQQVGKGRDNVAVLKKDPNRLKDAVLGALPSTLFVLLPIFALMLKIAYVFKRRLYMEHLIVALNSHAFLCMALLLVFALDALGNAVPALAAATGTLEGITFAWMPLYLLLVQKRVYAQGWLMTLLKYCVLGVCYLVLLSLGVAFTMIASLVWA